jgi:histidinol-phosphatase
VSPDLELALSLAALADSLSLPRFRATDLVVERKPDLSPVTDADRAVERALRERLGVERPDDAVAGEEEGVAEGERRWILDPIDGTRNFSRGIPVWATLVALEAGGELVLGVVSAPALGHRWWAERGIGAWRDGEPIRVSTVGELANAAVSCSYPSDLARIDPHVWHPRGFADFWQSMLVAEGSLDACVDSRLELWDYAALTPIVLEAGGRVTTLTGGEPASREQFVCSNGLVHDDVLAVLADR